MLLTPAALGPELEAKWRALPTKTPVRGNWAHPTTPSPMTRCSHPCRVCGGPLDDVITTPPPAGCGRDAHPCCATGEVWLCGDVLDAAEAMLTRRAAA